jgi:ABC-type branched-subunit amino acid transport system permease subunit
MPEHPYLHAIQTALHGTGLPYGYAITVWSTGSVVSERHGMPSLAHVACFAAGAVAAYGGLTFLTWETEGEAEKPLTRSPQRVRAGLVHVAAIAAAIASAAAVARISSGAAWALAPFAATLLYLAISSVEVGIVEAKQSPS